MFTIPPVVHFGTGEGARGACGRVTDAQSPDREKVTCLRCKDTLRWKQISPSEAAKANREQQKKRHADERAAWIAANL